MTEALDIVWKALADPTRRQVLDMLRSGPRTTGQLAASFDMSRFGVMKHLGVLEQAGLITVRRQGRERFNHLNAVPIRRIYERWVDRYAEHWASSLTRLEELVSRGDETMKNFVIAQEIALDASPEKVWKALTTDIGKWWAYRVGEGESSISIEPKIGGYFREDWGDGDGELWGTVTYVSRGKKLRLQGGLGMRRAGINDYAYELEAKGDKTLLKLTHHGYGPMDDDAEKDYREGWSGLLERFLKGWLEEGKTAAELKED